MIKIMIKRHQHQRRFETDKVFSDDEVNQAFDYADRIIAHTYAVQIKSKPWYSDTFSELRTQFNGQASTM